ncbi:hypothetical protein BGW80DRAFT_1345637 [Lactifluus volemus]|nr:hypothetical protein BGW80DRAFT_1345637 [Lactifluus volemus]
MSASTSQRRSTVHDLATLRLHPDGKRVSITSPPRVGLNTSRRHNVGYDTRGNRNARDAAGVGLVPKRPVIQEDEGGKRQRRKRRRIDNEVEFLANSGRGVLRTGDDADLIGSEGMSWPPPSSDLLKCVHYFASQYYGARGLLSNRERIYRRERKRRRKAGDVHEADEDADDLFAEDEEDSENNDIEEERHEGHVVQDGVGGEKMKENAPDMYRALDGSALMAIGMLLQEHISKLLKPSIPSGWEEEMKAACVASEDERIDQDQESEDAEDSKSSKSADEEIEISSRSTTTEPKSKSIHAHNQFQPKD